jgi:hypothetical protein
VAGIPNPQSTHAVIICRFAWECLIKFNETVKELEVELVRQEHHDRFSCTQDLTLLNLSTMTFSTNRVQTLLIYKCVRRQVIVFWKSVLDKGFDSLLLYTMLQALELILVLLQLEFCLENELDFNCLGIPSTQQAVWSGESVRVFVCCLAYIVTFAILIRVILVALVCPIAFRCPRQQLSY